MYQYPYGDTQQLNLDWILTKIKELEQQSGGSSIEEVANALISATYNAVTQYRRYDYCFYNGKLYRCLTDTTGAFTPADWQEVLIGDDIPILTRLINAIDTSAVMDVKFETTGTNGKLQQKYNNAYHDVVEVDYTPVQNSKRPLSSNAGYDLNAALSNKQDVLTFDNVPTNGSNNPVKSDGVYDADAVLQGEISANVEPTATASRAYSKGDYLVFNGQLYKVINDIANGGTITVNTNVSACTIGNELTSLFVKQNLTITESPEHGSASAQQIGNIVFVQTGIDETGVTRSTPWTVLGRLPAGHRPAQEIYFAGWYRISGQGNDPSFSYFRVKTDGYIQIYCSVANIVMVNAGGSTCFAI